MYILSLLLLPVMSRNLTPNARDKRYKAVKVLIENGVIVSYAQIFEYIPKSVIAHHMGINWERMEKRIRRPGEWKAKDIILLGNLIGLDPAILFKFIVDHKHKT